jgi:hypothetical protein
MRRPCPFESEGCPLSNTVDGCFVDTHHKQYPRSAYRTPTERRFRELDENKVDLCRAVHNEIHATEPAPIKPSLEVMQFAIQQEREARVRERDLPWPDPRPDAAGIGQAE